MVQEACNARGYYFVKMFPTISVIIPTYNSGEFITRTLESVLSQTYKNFEIIISDDESTDETIKRADDFFDNTDFKKFTILSNPHKGPGDARNKGIDASMGDWIAFLDSDDMWMPEKLEKTINYINNYPTVDLICHNEIRRYNGREYFVDHSSKYNKRISLFVSLLRNNCFSPSAVIVRRKFLLEAGCFDVTLPAAQDYDLWLRLSLLNITIGFINEPLGFYMERDGSISSNIDQRLSCLLKIGDKYFCYLGNHTSFPFIERLRYEGKAYSSAGLGLILKGDILKGLKFFVIGMLKWPVRDDWFRKIAGIKYLIWKTVNKI